MSCEFISLPTRQQDNCNKTAIYAYANPHKNAPSPLPHSLYTKANGRAELFIALSAETRPARMIK